jgi:hypothetical protein
MQGFDGGSSFIVIAYKQDREESERIILKWILEESVMRMVQGWNGSLSCLAVGFRVRGVDPWDLLPENKIRISSSLNQAS